MHVSQGVATVEFGHPAGNSFPSGLLQRLAREINRLSLLEEAKVLVIKSEGERTFCAGASFDELLAIENPKDGKHFFEGFAKLLNTMRTCPKPIIARVQGRAVGGGVGLIAACDMAVATANAGVKLSELNIGIGPFVIAPVVERKIGIAALTQLGLAPYEWQNAYWAREKGLYAKVFDSLKEVDLEVARLAEELASYHSSAVQQMKKILWEGTDHWDTLLKERAEISGTLVLSDQTKKMLKKFRK